MRGIFSELILSRSFCAPTGFFPTFFGQRPECSQVSAFGGNLSFNMTRGSDGRSLGGCAENQTVDWQRTLAEHDRWLRTIVYARLGEPAAVDDVMQEVALAAVKQAAPLQDTERVAPWLYQLAVRQVLMYRRRRGRQRDLLNRYEQRQPSATATPASDPLAWLLADERERLVRRAVEQLPRRDAEILMLKYSEDWSYDQIAAHLGISRSAVEARLHRARGRLRERLLALDVNGESE